MTKLAYQLEDERLGLGYDHAEVIDDLMYLKGYAGTAVKQIYANRLMLDVSLHDVGYLTCVEVCENDMPWIAAKKAEMAKNE
jgi:hypothetical protein